MLNRALRGVVLMCSSPTSGQNSNREEHKSRRNSPHHHASQYVSFGSWADLGRLAVFCIGYLITALLPRRLDGWAIQSIVETFLALRQGRVSKVARRMESVLGPFTKGFDFDQLASTNWQMRLEDLWGRLRAMHRGGWQVETKVEGLEVLQEALHGGHGVILWGMSFCKTLVVKVALWRAGVRLTQLSSAYHGSPGSRSLLGLRLVAPIHCIAENRYLFERVVIPPDGSLGYMKRLKARLAQNGCVWITGEYAGRQMVTTTFLGRQVGFATGAPSLAWKQGSPLLPVYVVREAHFRYRVVIERPLDPDRSRDKRVFVESAVRQFAERLQHCVLNNPADWSLGDWSWRETGDWCRGVVGVGLSS